MNASLTWKVNSLRLSAFLSPLTASGTIDWWNEVISEEPSLIKPRDGLKQVQLGEVLITNIVNAIRIDWVYEAILDQEKLPELPVLGIYPDATYRFFELMDKWLELDNLPDFTRLALGSTVLDPTDNHVHTYRKLADYLTTVRIDEENSSDLLYQINRPKASHVLSEVTINRLTKWSALTIQGRVANMHQLISLGHAVNLEVDINTAPKEGLILPKTSLKDLVHEFRTLMDEILENGDKI